MSLADEELLSAYLDGELTADERSRVEQLLAESPESRQLLEELRSIQSSMLRMPRAGLGHDFAEQVLREAKSQAAAGKGDDNGSDGDRLVSQRTAPIEPAERAERLSGFSWQRMRRPVIWASLSLAAGLLIMFYEGSQGRKPGGRQVARVRADAPERAAGEIGAARKEPANESQDRPAGDLKTYDEQADHYRRSMPEPASATTGAPEAPPAPAPMSGESRSAGASSADGRGFAPAAAKPAQAAADKDAGLKLAQQKEEKPGGDNAKDALAGNDETVVVWCDVAPESNYSESFRNLLAKQNIKWQEEPEVAERFALGLDESQVQRATKEPADDELLARRAEQSRLKRLADAEQAVRDPGSEVVLVEATQPQIDAVLAAIDGASKVFVNVDVEPPADASREQRQFQRFARGAVVQEKLSELRDEAKELKKSAAASLDAQAAKQAANRPRQNQSAEGTARRLTVQTANESELLTQKTDEKAPKHPQLAQSRVNRERDAKSNSSDDSPTVLSAGLGGAAKAAAQVRVQVLFVLHPMETDKTSDER